MNTIVVPSGENWGSLSKPLRCGESVTRVASSTVTPSGSEAGMIQIPFSERLPQSDSIAMLVPLGAQPGVP